AQCGVGEQERAEKIRVHDLTRRLERDERRRIHVRYPRVVDKDVQYAVTPPDLAEQLPDPRFIGDVEVCVRVALVRDRLPSPGAADDDIALRDVVADQMGADAPTGSRNEDVSCSAHVVDVMCSPIYATRAGTLRNGLRV